jgi:hypothetical protein
MMIKQQSEREMKVLGDALDGCGAVRLIEFEFCNPRTACNKAGDTLRDNTLLQLSTWLVRYCKAAGGTQISQTKQLPASRATAVCLHNTLSHQ